jgi:hypothetical protein
VSRHSVQRWGQDCQHQPHSAAQKRDFSASDTDFDYRLCGPYGLVRVEGLGKPHRLSNPRLSGL